MKKIVFDVDSAEIVDESDSQFALAKIHAFSSGLNRHNLTCDVETLKRTAHTLYEKPVVFDYDPRWGDFGGHVEQPFIAGFVVPDSATFDELPDGRIGLNVLAKVWKYYSKNFVDIFATDSEHKRKVSVEMELVEVEQDKSGIEKMMDFVYTAIAVLGTFVTEASPGAHMQMLTFSQMDNKERYFKEFGKYDSIDFTIPENVKRNAKKGLSLYEKHRHGGTSVSLATARYLVKNEIASPDRVRHMSGFFSRRSKDDLSDKSSPAWISWMLWGSHAGKKWSDDIVSKMDAADEEMAVYFEEEDIMPYDSMKEVNPAIKGIDPPVTLAQANQIAREAEAIGVDEESNGWAIAISNFKKNHKVEDGKWIKKESMSLDEDSNEKEENTLKDELEKTEEFMAEEEEAPKEEMQEEEEPAKEEMEESPKEEMQEEEDDKEEDSGEEEMSSVAYSEAGAVMEMLDGVEGFSVPENGELTNDELVPFMHAKMIQMSEELSELREYKQTVENSKLKFEIDAIIQEVQGTIPDDELEELKGKVEEFSTNIEGWKNLVRAKAFEYSQKDNGKDENEEEQIVKYAIPFVGAGESKSNGQPFS